MRVWKNVYYINNEKWASAKSVKWALKLELKELCRRDVNNKNSVSCVWVLPPVSSVAATTVHVNMEKKKQKPNTFQ